MPRKHRQENFGYDEVATEAAPTVTIARFANGVSNITRACPCDGFRGLLGNLSLRWPQCADCALLRVVSARARRPRRIVRWPLTTPALSDKPQLVVRLIHGTFSASERTTPAERRAMWVTRTGAHL